MDVLVIRKSNVCCVQETRWRGAGVRMLNGFGGLRHKCMWQGILDGLNGISIVISEELMDKVVEVVRANE